MNTLVEPSGPVRPTFRRRFRGEGPVLSAPIDRWPARRHALERLREQSATVVHGGRATFFAERSMTYLAADAIIMHFHDIVHHRLDPAHTALLEERIDLSAVRTTRNIVAHDYEEADKETIWRVMTTHLPAAIAVLVD